jgi:hypothetical protein
VGHHSRRWWTQRGRGSWALFRSSCRGYQGVRCSILAGCWFLSLGPCIRCTNKILRNMAQSLAAEGTRRVLRLLSAPPAIANPNSCHSCRQQASHRDWPNQTFAVGPSRAVPNMDIGGTRFRRTPTGGDGLDGYPTLPTTKIHAGSNLSCNHAPSMSANLQAQEITCQVTPANMLPLTNQPFIQLSQRPGVA